MNHRSVLVSGASLAGPALAHWLGRYGFDVTVVERAPALREGGQAVDFRGEAHLAMIERMGLLEDIRARQTAPCPLTLIDTEGRPVVTLPAGFTGGDVEILRGDLSRLLYDRTKDSTEYVFGDSIRSLTDTPGGVEVTFDNGAPRRFDLVLGADGLHSNVRRLAFGDESAYVSKQGYHVAIFSAPNRMELEHADLLYNEPGRGISVATTHDPSRLSVLCVFHEPGLGIDHRDVDGQREALARAFASVGWEASTLMKHMWDAGDFYSDAISIVRMDRYTTGRIGLVGDAGYGATCGGMGAGMAMIAAYVMAGELAASGGSHRLAYASYEQQLRKYAKACQRVAAGAGPFLAPPTEAKILSRNRIYRVLTTRPMLSLLNRLTTRAASSIALADYPG